MVFIDLSMVNKMCLLNVSIHVNFHQIGSYCIFNNLSIWFFRKDDKYVHTYLLGEFLALNYVFIVFFSRNKSDDSLILFVHQKYCKLAFKTGFSVHNAHLYLCWQVANNKWILYCRKMVLNAQQLRFLMYNGCFCIFCEM